MRALFAILHVYNPGGDPKYSSSDADPTSRINALRTCLRTLRATFSPSTLLADLERRDGRPVPAREPVELDIVVCVTGDLHLLDQVPPEEVPYRRHRSDLQPMLSGFHCREVLAEGLGTYDYYCYIEDDIIVGDPLFFTKLKWFDLMMGPERLLQPNRFETGPDALPPKVYIDGPIRYDDTRMNQEVRDRPEMTLNALGQEVRFVRPLNPHSGCFFLNQRQMEEWASRPYFRDGDVSFVGPLESIATLGVMKTFEIYKPAAENPAFLEVMHLDNRWWRRVFGQLAWLE